MPAARIEVKSPRKKRATCYFAETVLFTRRFSRLLIAKTQNLHANLLVFEILHVGSADLTVKKGKNYGYKSEKSVFDM